MAGDKHWRRPGSIGKWREQPVLRRVTAHWLHGVAAMTGGDDSNSSQVIDCPIAWDKP